MRKLISSIIAVTTLISLSFNCSSMIPETNAASYRTSYKIYGDLNNDKVINSFDVISMRKAIISGDTSLNLDFNRDNKVDSADLTLLSDYVLGNNTFFDAYLYDDADEDSVCDMLEIAILESDPDSKDSDGDTLSDFYEVVYTNTSPTNKNTRGLSVMDDADDADGDKLTNKEEISANTNPQLDDSDLDGINDYDELKKYKTDPNNEDSDNDGIIDGDEINLGLKPDSDKSDGQTPDNQRTFENKISASNELLSHINTEDTPYEVSIDIKSAGNIEKTLTIHTGAFSNTSEDDRFIGKSIMFSYDEKLTVDTAKIYFKPKSIDGSIENYMIFEFFPETNYLLPVETKYTSDSAYVETNELGTFTLVKTSDSSQSSNSVKMAPYNVLADEKSEISVGKNDVVYDYKLGSLEVAFFVDNSGTLTDNLEETQKSIHDCCQAIFEHSDDSYIEIYGYYTSPNLSTSKTYIYADSNGDSLLNNINSVDEALEALTPYTTNTQNTLNSAIFTVDAIKDDLFSNDNSQKYAFIMSNSDYSFTNSNEYKLTIPIAVRDSFEEIYDSNIHLNFLLSKGIFANTTAVNNLKAACKPYNFGIYSNLENGYFGNSGFARLYSDAITDIYKESICYVSTLTPQSIPKEVNRNAFLNSLPFSYDKSKVPAADANGNINFKDAAVKIGAAYYDANGNLVFPSMLDVCSYNELTRIGYEQYMKNRSTSERLIAGSIQITPFSDKILYEDTDGDGIPDINDPYPNKPFDNQFEIVADYNYEPNIDFVDRHYYNSQNCYDSKLPSINVLGRLIAIISGALRDSSSCADFLSPYLNQADFDFGLHPERENNSSDIKHAFDAMRHYFWGGGKEVFYSQKDTCEMISSSIQNIMHLFDNLNRTMRCSEEMLKDGNSVIIALKSNKNLKAACLIKNKAENDTDNPIDIVNCEINTNKTGLKDHEAYYCNYVHRDWNLTIGEALGTIVAKVERNGDKFTMTYRYYFKDIYEWAYHYEQDHESVSTALHAAHEDGLAQEYLMQGHYDGGLSWTLGEKITSRDIAQQIFLTLADREEGLGDNPSVIWTNSNEIDRFKEILSMEW
ncbi:dockerin type I domain-containing protein [Ruminococcus sp.]|uniref:dockerin type I domain-containing protein n=1 Tax=Ruminococcus sp. TaxID=41978 RepID=UPI0025DA0C27|nr:dockerin type I domain-containing protein [Ruminococcus sp.]MBR1431453.1 hypothetical protein [Ruminococcus sp.]